MDFIKRFTVIFAACIFLAGLFLSKKVLGIGIGNYLLYTLPPFFLGLLIVMGALERSAGMLAFGIVAAAIFVYLLLIDRKVAEKLWIVTAVAGGAGVLIYFFQIHEGRRK